jgi:hypothetical protein
MLYVIDHDGETPEEGDTEPYANALRRVAGSCPDATLENISDMATAVSEKIERDTGRRRTTLEVLELFPADKDPSFTCEQAFAVEGVILQGSD